MIDFILVITALFLFIVAPILLLLAFVKPDILKIMTPKHPEGKVSRKQFLIGLLVSWIVCLGIGMAVVPEVEPVTIADTLEKEGIDSSEYTVHDNGAIEIHAPEAEAVDTTQKMTDSSLPVSANSEGWEYVVNNAVRTADSYATSHNLNASFIGNNISTTLNKQIGGDYEGQYLMTVLNDTDPDLISYAQLRPLFDMDSSVTDLDDEKPLWEVTTAKLNGQAF